MSTTVWHVGGDDVRMRIPLLLALRDRGFSVAALGSEPGEPFADSHIPYWRYELNRWLNPLADRRTVASLRELIGAHRPDVVHAFDTKPGLLVPAAAKTVPGCGCVRTVTGMGYVFSANSPLALTLRPLYRAMQQRAAAATDMTIFQNPDDRDYFLRHRMAKAGREALVLGSGIDIEGVSRRRPDEQTLAGLRRELGLNGPVVTMVARLVKTKGVLEYIAAAAAVRRQRPEVTFLLVGPQASEGRQAVPAETLRQAEGTVRWLGARDDVPALLTLSDLLVLPSYYREGVPRVLLEAAVLGRALITTDMPGCKEVVRHGHNGLLVPPRDADALAAAVLRLLGDDRVRAEMGARGRSHVRQFALPKVADRYADIYRRVLTGADAVTAVEAAV